MGESDMTGVVVIGAAAGGGSQPSESGVQFVWDWQKESGTGGCPAGYGINGRWSPGRLAFSILVEGVLMLLSVAVGIWMVGVV